VYAVAAGRVFRSRDRGSHWRQLWARPNENMGPLAVSPAAPGLVYGASDRAYVYRSVDGGRRWRVVSNLHSTVAVLVANPRRARTVWAGTTDHGFLRSSDGGRTWKHAVGIRGLPKALVVNPSNPRILYAATWISPPYPNG